MKRKNNVLLLATNSSTVCVFVNSFILRNTISNCPLKRERSSARTTFNCVHVSTNSACCVHIFFDTKRTTKYPRERKEKDEEEEIRDTMENCNACNVHV